MVEFQFLQSFILALALGAFVGLEREYARYKKRGHDYAGIRTFWVISLFGALAAYFGQLISVWIIILCIAIIATLIILSYFVDIKTNRKYHGATSEVAGFITFFVGLLCYYQEYTFAAFITIIMTIILYARSRLHHFAEHLKRKELADTLKFAVVAFIILPFLPDKGYGPYEIFNPYLTWSMVVLNLGISFIGYILMRWRGEQGIILTGLLGGVVSSTATTLHFAQRSIKEKTLTPTLALGTIIANGTMFLRILFLILILNSLLYQHLLLPLIALTIVTSIICYTIYKKLHIKNVSHPIHVESPFRLYPSIRFALLFSLILAITKIAYIFFQDKGILFISAFSGLSDVYSIILSLSQLAGTGITYTIASKGILIAILTNFAIKIIISLKSGSKEFNKITTSILALLMILGIGIYFLL
jgi:uncharacterized membrane protein (DUF4010 family)